MNASLAQYVQSLKNPSAVLPRHLWRAQVTTVATAALGGYLITGMHPNFLALFEHPLMQFLTCFMIFHLSLSDDTPFTVSMFDAILLTLFIQVVAYISNRFWAKDTDKDTPMRPRWTKLTYSKDYLAMAAIGIVILIVSFRVLSPTPFGRVDMTP